MPCFVLHISCAERFLAALSYCIVYYGAGTAGSWVRCKWNPKVWPFKWKLLSRTFLSGTVYIILYKVVVTFESGDVSYCACMYYVSVVLFVMMYNASWGGCWTFESMDEIFFINTYVVTVISVLDRRNLKCDPNERKIETLVKQRSFLLSCLSCY